MVLPFLDDAYTLARHLTRHEFDAQDVVQEASLRAWRHFDGFRGGNPRVWLLTIVRHTAYTWLSRASHRATEALDDVGDDVIAAAAQADDALAVSEQRAVVSRALAQLPRESREIVVLRDIEDLSYQEIARVLGVPIGTVMSRLARARQRLRTILSGSER